MKNYEQKVYELRREIVNGIINLLKEHDLKELELVNAPEDLCDVLWFDNAGNTYDSPVKKVSFDENGICLYVEDEKQVLRPSCMVMILLARILIGCL